MKRSKRKKRKKRKSNKPSGCGLGAHQKVSPMGHSTRTKTRVEKRRQRDRKRKQNGWCDDCQD